MASRSAGRISATEAADQLGLSRSTMCRHCARGDLKATRQPNGTWSILRSDLVKFERRRREAATVDKRIRGNAGAGRKG